MRGAAIPVLLLLLSVALAGCVGGDGSAQGIEGMKGGFDAPEREAPDFELVNQDGETVTMDSLEGKVVVIDFVYTSCDSVCPVLTSKFKDVQEVMKEEEAFGDEVVLVSISFDPRRDTRARLRDFGNRFGADFSGWQFLRPQSEDEARSVISSFGAHYEQENGSDQFTHTAAAIVVNPEGKIVKEFHGTKWSPDSVAEAALKAR